MNDIQDYSQTSEATYQLGYRLPYTSNTLKKNKSISLNDFCEIIKKEFNSRTDFENLYKEPVVRNRIIRGFYTHKKIDDISYILKEEIHDARLQYWRYISDDTIFLKRAEELLKKFKIKEDHLYILAAIYMKEIIMEKLYTHYTYKWLYMPRVTHSLLKYKIEEAMKEDNSYKEISLTDIENQLQKIEKVVYTGENYKSPLLHRENKDFYNFFIIKNNVDNSPEKEIINPYNLWTINTIYKRVYPISLYIRELFLEDYIKRKTNNYNESMMFSIKETDDVLMSTDEGARFLYNYFRIVFFEPLIMSTPMMLGEESLDRMSWEESLDLGEVSRDYARNQPKKQ